MARTRVKLQDAGMHELLRAPKLKNLLHDHGERMLAAARAGAPVLTGAYRDSLHLETAITDRAVVRVVADVPHAMAVEASTGNLARAVDV